MKKHHETAVVRMRSSLRIGSLLALAPALACDPAGDNRFSGIEPDDEDAVDAGTSVDEASEADPCLRGGAEDLVLDRSCAVDSGASDPISVATTDAGDSIVLDAGDAEQAEPASTVDAGESSDAGDPAPSTVPELLETEAVVGALAVESFSRVTEVIGGRFQVNLRVVNATDVDVALRDVMLRYYFTSDTSAVPSFRCLVSETGGCEAVSTTLVESAEDADAPAQEFVEVRFDSAAVLAAGAGTELRGSIGSSQGPSDLTNDYSFLLADSYTPNPRILAYFSGRLAWGAPPLSSVVQAETLITTGTATVATNHAGWTGEGMVASVTTEGSGLLGLMVSQETSGPAELFVRYAMGNRTIGFGTLGLVVNGTRQQTASFEPTNQWTRWSTASFSLALDAGDNEVAFLFQSGDTGFVNFDALWFGPLP